MQPDIVINPHGFVSRMTIGMLVEALAGKACAVQGRFCNATPFRDVPKSEFADILRECGYAASGCETFYDGRSGQKIHRPLFVGVVTYQRLRHLVMDKINSRARGSKHILTEQPMDGRAKGGGLRIGEMERGEWCFRSLSLLSDVTDCVVAHGAASVLHERLFLSSDKKTVSVCRQCGLLAEPARNRSFAYGPRGAGEFFPPAFLFDFFCDRILLPQLQPQLLCRKEHPCGQ
jgi:DNA-directed RNA polymerase subunit B